MPALAETQAAFRTAIGHAGPSDILTRFRAPSDPAERLEIYRRHFRESFRRHLRGRFPTLEWLIGTEKMLMLADATLQRDPPRAPSLAEYGEALIATLATEIGTDLPAYLTDVARLDWSLGRLAVEVEKPPVTLADLAAWAGDALLDQRLTLQPGLAFVASAWPVDELVHLHLAASTPDQFALAQQPVWLQLRGARGSFRLERLAPAEFVFRSRLFAGRSLAESAEHTLSTHPDFDLTGALVALFAEGLVAGQSSGELQ